MTVNTRTSVVLVALVALTACAPTRTREAPGEYFDDANLTAHVKSALIVDPATKAHQIEVETFRGVVQLSGFVNSTNELETATQVAASVRGVKSVHNNLEVRMDGETAGEVLDDSVVTTRVKTALIANPVTKARQINVETTAGGVVQLSGFVDSASEKLTATEVANSVSGVREVHNELEIKQGS